MFRNMDDPKALKQLTLEFSACYKHCLALCSHPEGSDRDKWSYTTLSVF